MNSHKWFSIFIAFIFCSNYVFAQGTTCTNAITIPLNGTCNSYSVSTTTGSSIHCTGSGFGGNGRVTYFRFTTNATPECVLLDMITSVAGVKLEAVLFSGCTAGTPTGGDAYQSICMTDGSGVWGSNLWWSNLVANTTYYLRVRTENGFTGTIQICGKYNTPTNNLCAGATAIDATLYADNNTCNTGSTEVTPASLCAGSLENTSWYSFTVLTTGTTSIIISSMNCDNANFPGNNDYGFQIGFFTGSCGSLSSLNCVAQTGSSGGTIIATTPALTAGTVISVAIDGFAGSNCKYSIQAINSVPLPVKLKYFEGWKGVQHNLLRWVTTSEENNNYFEIERSNDGISFIAIGRISGRLYSQSEISYSFNDNSPLQIGYYRLKQVDIHKLISYSRVIKIERNNLQEFKVVFANPVQDIFRLNIETTKQGIVQMNIVDVAGRTMLLESLNCNKGINQFNIDLSKLQTGAYFLVIIQDGIRKTYPVIKY